MLNGLSIGKRLALVLSVILALSLLSGVLVTFKLRQLGQELDTMMDDNLKTERAAVDWMRHTTAGVQRASAIAKSTDASLVEYFAPMSAASIGDTNRLQKLIEEHMDTAEEKALFEKVGTLRKTYLAARDEVNKLKKDGDSDGAAKAFGERFEPTSKLYLAGVQEMVDLQRKQLDASATRSEALRSQASTLLAVCGVLSVGLGALLSWLLSRSITQPLRRAESIARSIADMDLSGRPQDHYANDETGRLLRSLDAMRAALVKAMQQVRG